MEWGRVMYQGASAFSVGPRIYLQTQQIAALPSAEALPAIEEQRGGGASRGSAFDSGIQFTKLQARANSDNNVYSDLGASQTATRLSSQSRIEHQQEVTNGRFCFSIRQDTPGTCLLQRICPITAQFPIVLQRFQAPKLPPKK